MIKLIILSILAIVGLFFTYCVIADEIEGKPNHCECIDYDCGCCAKLDVKDVVDGKLCSNFSYLPDQYGISLTITFNEFALFNETVSAKNPPPICVIHIERVQMEFCFKFYDLDIKNKHFSGCAEFEISLAHIFPLKKIELGCFGRSGLAAINSRFHEFLNSFRNDQDQGHEPQVVYI